MLRVALLVRSAQEVAEKGGNKAKRQGAQGTPGAPTQGARKEGAPGAASQQQRQQPNGASGDMAGQGGGTLREGPGRWLADQMLGLLPTPCPARQLCE